ncbi:MAG: ubiquinol-cytochrome C chaperone, partial [Aestuariivirgaceae bacterium]|nr:ubiquinol-cytochrome C chaperone [Aestuariivirgaceae bacterium]
AYRTALKAGDDAALAQAIARNVYPEGAPKGAAEFLAVYVKNTAAHLEKQPVEALLAGNVTFLATAEIQK